MNILDILEKGGILLWPIGLCSLIGWFVFFQRLFVFRIASGNKVFGNDIYGQIAAGDIADARRSVNLQNQWKRSRLSARDRLLLEVIEGDVRDRLTLETILGHGVEKEIKYLSSHLSTLATMGSISPLLGLLGTVIGMIKAFIVVEEMGGRVNASVLAGGIWEAMLTTALGLIVAIPLMIFHSYLLGRLNAIQTDLEDMAVSLIRIWPTLPR